MKQGISPGVAVVVVLIVVIIIVAVGYFVFLKPKGPGAAEGVELDSAPANEGLQPPVDAGAGADVAGAAADAGAPPAEGVPQ